MQLSFERVSATGLYLLDLGDFYYLYVCRGLHQFVLERIFGVTRCGVFEKLGENVILLEIVLKNALILIQNHKKMVHH